MNLHKSLDNIVEGSEENEIEINENNKFELTISYNNLSKQLFISHFYIYEKYRRNNLATKIYNKFYHYALNNEKVNSFKFHIKKTAESKKWLDNMNESYHITTVGNIGKVIEINYST